MCGGRAGPPSCGAAARRHTPGTTAADMFAGHRARPHIGHHPPTGLARKTRGAIGLTRSRAARTKLADGAAHHDQRRQ